MDSFYFNPYVVPVLISFFITLFLSISSYIKHTRAGTEYFSLLMLFCSIYSFFYALEISTTDFELMTKFLKLEYLGAAFLAPCITLFSIHYSDNRLANKPIIAWGLFSLSTIVFVLVLSNDAHHLFYSNIQINNNGVFPILVLKTGPAYWVHQIYAILGVLSSNILFFRLMNRIEGFYKKQIAIILIGSLAAWSTHLFYLIGFSPWGLDPIPFAFMISGLIIYIGIVNFKLFHIYPVARKLLFENLKDAVFLLDTKGRLINYNQKALPYLVAKNNMIGESIEKVFKTKYRNLLDVLKSIPNDQFIHQISIEENENSVTLELDIHQIWDNQLKSLVGNMIIIRDISERVEYLKQSILKDKILTAVAQSTEILLKEEDFYKACAECLEIIGSATEVDRVYIFQNIYDQNNHINHVNQILEWNSGIKESQINNPELQEIDPNDFHEFFIPLFAKKPFSIHVDELPSGKLKEILSGQDIISILVLALYEKEKFWGFVGFDECKYKRAWKDVEFSILSSFATSISAAIERQNLVTELLRSVQVAEIANQSKGVFLSNMSHEIRTPLNGILGFASLLSNTSLDEEQREFISKINNSGSILLNLVNDILNMSKIESGKLEIIEEEIELLKYLHDICDLISLDINRNNIELILNVDPDLPKFIKADSLRLWQVIMNLLTNANKFTESGEIEFRVELKKRSAQNITLKFIVRDTGIGIPKDSHGKIFEIFTQADSSTTRKFGGSGLGLTISSKLLSLMNATLVMKSKENEGSEFSFELTTSYSGNENILSDYALSHPKNIILVENNSSQYSATTKLLQAMNFNVISVNSTVYQEILIPEDLKIDLVLCDLTMLKENPSGTDIDHSFLKHIITKQIPVGGLESNSVDQIEKEKLKLIGINYILKKPIKPNRLLDLIFPVNFASPEIKKSIDSEYTVEIDHRKFKVLIVEDDPTNRKLAQKILEKYYPNCTINMATNGLEAIDSFKNDSPELIFMDIQMPVMNGYESAKLIRESNNDVRIIALTASIGVEDRHKCLEAGMDAYLMKPYTTAAIRELVEKFI